MSQEMVKHPPAAVLRPRAHGLPADLGRLLVVLALLLFAFALASPQFFSWPTFAALASQMPPLLLVSVGMTFVLVTGGIDLSVGSTMALGGAVLGVTMISGGRGLILGLLASVATGLILGLGNGLVLVTWRLPSFIVTLGTLEMARGATYLLTHSQTQYIGGRVERLSELHPLGLPFPFLLAVLVVAGAQLVLSRTVFGRYAVAVGTNEEAVRLTGIDPRWIKVKVFALAGGLAGLAAVVHTSRLAAADPNAGVGMELQAIAAVVVGGTSLLGGRGSIVGSALGVAIIAVLDAGLAQLGAQEPVKRLVTGFVIVAAVILDNLRQKRQRR